MKTIKVAEATGIVLDWLVAVCKGMPIEDGSVITNLWFIDEDLIERPVEWNPTEDWAQGGPIIEREKIELIPPKDESDPDWMAVWLNSEDAEAGIQNGPTPLIAAMRCFVASKLGETADVPEELG